MLEIVRTVGQLRYFSLLELYEEDLYPYLQGDFFRRPGCFCAFLVLDEKYAAGVRLEPFRDGYLVTGLRTAPTLRRQGLATELLRGALTYLAGEFHGCVYSHVATGNTASRAVHEKCGFSRQAGSAVMLDGSVLADHCTYFCIIS